MYIYIYVYMYMCIYVYMYTSVDLCISMHRGLWMESHVDLAVMLSVSRFVKYLVMYFYLRLVFP